MKKLLLVLSLAAVAWAKPSLIAHCPTSGDGFSVKFSRPHTTVKQADGIAYGWESKSTPLQSELVYVNSKKSLKQLKAYVLKNMPQGSRVTEETPFLVGKNHGLQLDGINENGVPFAFRLLSTQAHGYLYGSTTYDLAHNRAFVQSFAIVPR